MLPPVTLQPSSRPLVYPPEIVALIIEHLGNQSPIGLPRWTWHRFDRNRQLLQAALIGPAWASAALSLLYSDLRLVWRTTSGLKLLRALKDRPELLQRTRSVEVHVLSLLSMTQDLNDTGPSILDWDELRKEWDAGGGGDQRARITPSTTAQEEQQFFDSWAMDLEWDAKEESIEEGPDGPWVRQTDDYDGIDVGNRVFWGLVASLPRLRHLTIEDTDYDPSKAVTFGGVEVYPFQALKALDSLTIRSDPDLANHGNHATPPVNAILFAWNASRITIDQHFIYSHPTIDPSKLQNLPNLRQLHIIPSTIQHNHRPNPYTKLSESNHILDFAITTSTTLLTLSFDDPPKAQPTAPHRPSNLLIGEALALLPHLLSLSLTKSPEDDYGTTLQNVRYGHYPSTFLSALTSSTLTSFAIGDIPSKELLAALPPSLTSLTFNPRNGSRMTWLYEALLDQVIQDVLPTIKDRLPNLVLLTIDCRVEDDVPEELKPQGWNLIGKSVEMFGPSTGLGGEEGEERQLRREKWAADIGVCLRCREPGARVLYKIHG
ncbi:hypothetical protein RQP46_004267 [Phenoliferia psychrophenolica]